MPKNQELETLMDAQSRLSLSLANVQAAQKADEFIEALDMIGRRYDVPHLTFLVVRSGIASLPAPYYCSTYPERWIRTYIDNDYIAIDPTIAIVRSGLLPVDWSNFDRQSEHVRRLFDEASDHGVGPHGLAIPVRGAHGQRCLFSVASNLPMNDWKCLRTSSVHDLHILAYYLHERLFAISGARQSGLIRDLSRRERQCLQLLASGKIYKQIAAALGISENAVRLYMRSARRKLGATTSHHAVAKASYLELIEF